MKRRKVEKRSSRRAHNPEKAGSTPALATFKNGLKPMEQYGRSPLLETLLPAARVINDALHDAAIERITGVPMSKRDHRELHKFCTDAMFFGRGILHVQTKNGKRIIKHIPMDRPAPDFDEPTQRDMDRYLTSRPCKRRNTR